MESRSPDPEVARPASQPIHAVRTIRDVRIPVSDGLELSANLWLPEPRDTAGPGSDERFPAILEMIPYRKDDWRAPSDQARGEWLAARGFALCRLDVRGTGSSPGIALDEYTAREAKDGCEAVEWLAAQPWCNGNVGMWGISYGGFTAIQVAKLRPPALKAIVPMMATDDRYTDDVHYIGGCVTVSELSQYAVSMVGMNALPPRGEYRGARWTDEWRERLERTPVWLFEWLRQQHDGPYWRQGSLAPDYDAIEAAIFSIGGWMDSYVDPVLRMHERCTAPRKSLIGNWVHSYPDDAYPGPNLDWYHELVRFFDHWLKGIDNGVMDEPGFVVFRHEYAEPEPFPRSWPGEWLALDTWPAAASGELVLHLAPGALPLVGELREDAPPGAAVEGFRHRATTGTRASLSWGAGSQPNGLARDLRPDESLIPTFTSAPLEETLDVVGFAAAELAWESGARVATAVVRLMDVAPDGTSSQVTAGILNLTHRSSHASPEPLEPGAVHRVRVPMRATAYRFLPGHRIRLSVASSYWPVIWPSPVPSEHVLHLGGGAGSRLVLPELPAGAPTLPVPPFKTTPAGLRDRGTYRDEPPEWRITDDVIDGSVTVTTSEFGEVVLPDGRTSLYSGERLEMTARDDDPATARMHNEVVYRLRDGGAEVEVEASGTVRSTEADFHMSVELRVTLDGTPFFERDWVETIPRRLV
ncbi:MAG TPA: CocE/NonD family hydrolase [Candidatus Limnocylindrales bacterium]|nr:CocE/NonD family hydrolase [Candidatus Limnocylindrales bacterium]